MPKIKKLELLEAQKIAAGEVVERPANVIKELIENSIDAGATSIHVKIMDGGKESIKIIDNGCGMDAEDAQLCFEHHATSKITCVDDLVSITSFGFRGEALASIAAVSKITLYTKNEHMSHGIKIDKQADKIISTQEITHPKGTTLEIRDLFFNTPARKKFLKTTATEQRAITQLFHAFCFDDLHIYFSLTVDDHIVYTCPPVDHLKDRVAQIWQRHESERMIELLETKQEYFSITGIISDHQFYRYDKNHIFIFVNKRWIKNPSLLKAFIKGYANILPHDRFPVGIINISIAADQIDINVHPRKTEIQFLHPRIIENALTQAIMKTLESLATKRLSSSFIPQNNFPSHHTYAPLSIQKSALTTTPLFFHQPQVSSASPMPENVPPEHTIHHDEISIKPESQCQIIGQLHATYIVAQTSDGFILVDQHAAHERILYEIFRKNFQKLETVTLLFPEPFTLSAHDTALILDNLHVFHNHGLHIEQINTHTFIVKSSPIFIKHCSMHEMILLIIQLIKKEEIMRVATTITEKIHAQMACKAAVKAGDELTREHMSTLLHDLMTTTHHTTCPHGRPTLWHISLYELERKFKRKT